MREFKFFQQKTSRIDTYSISEGMNERIMDYINDYNPMDTRVRDVITLDNDMIETYGVSYVNMIKEEQLHRLQEIYVGLMDNPLHRLEPSDIPGMTNSIVTNG